MSVKSKLRTELKEKRKTIKNKAINDSKIREELICCNEYLSAQTVLFYASLKDEINIDDCIADALYLGKRVALPVCINSNGNMKYYYINSLDDLIIGHFGVREPDVNKCDEVVDFTNSICIVPAIAFDKKGYRLGYGKGYYDRFLENYASLSIGLCYNDLVVDELPIGEYDVPVNMIITQNGCFEASQGGNNG